MTKKEDFEDFEDFGNSKKHCVCDTEYVDGDVKVKKILIITISLENLAFLYTEIVISVFN